ncbi:MAG: hypothetical protein WCA22_19330 [Candidatus Binatus sp.]
MNKEIFDEIFADFSAANKLIERDPVVMGERLARAACDRILLPDLPVDVLHKGLSQRVGALSGRMKDAVERGRAYLIAETIIPEFANDLRDWMSYERRSGALKPWSAADKGKGKAHLFEGFAWHREPGMIIRRLERGDDFGKITFREVEIVGADGTHKPSFVRRDPRIDDYRPVGRSKESWYQEWCTPESVIAEAEAAARREEEIATRPFSATSGPNAGEATVVRR